MKVLFISTYDIQGGAAIAATRLLHAVRHAGCDASMVVRAKLGDDTTVFTAESKKKRNTFPFYRERGVIYLFNGLSREGLFDVSIANTGVSITKLPQFKEAEVIHLHWINQGMLSIKEIGKIFSSGKKVVWTMHDMWPITGICHYAVACDAYTFGCGYCPYLKIPSRYDLSFIIFRRKHSTYLTGNITFTACSQWLRELAEQSPLTWGHRITSIPNPIDTETYRPMDKSEMREKLNLPLDKRIILFAAVKATDKRKGMDYLVEASGLMAHHSENLFFLIAGGGEEEIEKQLALPARSMGYISPQQMPELYNAVDLFVTPSLHDNLPNTIMEAMACGTPCVGFHTGGIPEMIDHRKNGYVAEYGNAQDLANGLLWTLFEADTGTLSSNARKKVMEHYAQEIVAQQYKKIYES
ncbi:glycosyltransferase family 4 protein [Proteiniphilum sp. X52]|uniref:glycosyltransferase family 4 protein n=1 Tax=Proteiniphilum sp. X52 TaxID=2382159 RepID=UPI000F09A715|nr:glycosyltransferase family 4 protein [Proteiniphilum sp. X52]RNC66125.1 glycosyltransferase [Proteiniphilum sp. X52]